MKHFQIVLGSILYGLYTDGFVRDIITNIICMYAALVVYYILGMLRSKNLVIPLLFIVQLGFSQKYETKSVQFFGSYSYVASIAQKKVEKPIPIRMPYYDFFSDPTVGIQYRYSVNNSAAYASISLQQICIGNRLMTFLPIPIPFRRTNFTRIKIGIGAEALIDWNPNRYKPILNTDAPEVKSGLSYIDKLINKTTEKFNIPQYTEDATTWAIYIPVEYSMTFYNKVQIIPFINAKVVGKLDKINLEGGIRMTMSYDKITSKLKK